MEFRRVPFQKKKKKKNKKKNKKINKKNTNKEDKCYLKALYTFGNYQRPVFSLGVSKHKHKRTACENVGSIGHRTCEKTNLCAFRSES